MNDWIFLTFLIAGCVTWGFGGYYIGRVREGLARETKK